MAEGRRGREEGKGGGEGEEKGRKGGREKEEVKGD